jgi:hypothetical protein
MGLGTIMTSLIIWMLAFTISICISILTAAAGLPTVHLGVTALITLAIAIVAVQAFRRLLAEGVSRSALAASTSRFIGFIWIWAGIAVLFIYQFILIWREWWQFSIGLLLVGGLCFILSMVFQRDADAGQDDESILKISRLLNIIQIVGMLLAVIGLVADRKFSLTGAALRSDWAANNIFFFGALAIACIGAHAIASESRSARLPS